MLVKSEKVHYFRTQDGLEIDLLRDYPDDYKLDEIKLNRTINPHWKSSFEKISKLLKKRISGRILSPIEKEIQLSKNVQVKPWWEF